MGSFLTYNEYKLLCYRHGQDPLEKDEIGPFVRDARTKERRGEDLSEVFAFLCNQDGVITRGCLGRHAKKFGLDEDAIMGLLEALGQEQITIEDFHRAFGPCTRSKLP